jgi:hypothetical protein
MVIQARIALVAGTLSLLVIIGALAQTPSLARGRGQEWLSWSSDERTVFVGAYLQGYLMGKTYACIAAGELFGEHKPIRDLDQMPDRRCFRRAKGYSRKADDYASVISSFYSKHPEYRDIPVDYFMLLFTSDQYRTVEDIEQGIRKEEVRTTF